ARRSESVVALISEPARARDCWESCLQCWTETATNQRLTISRKCSVELSVVAAKSTASASKRAPRPKPLAHARGAVLLKCRSSNINTGDFLTVRNQQEASAGAKTGV